MTALEQQTCAPTEALDLHRDALASADLAFMEALDKVCYLIDLAENCKKFGYTLPYSKRQLEAARLRLHALAEQVKAQQG